MPQMSKVELYAAIRRDNRDGMSMRELERKHGVTWRTVRKALDSSWPEPRKKLPPRATGLDPFKPVIDEILRSDLDAPRKQRHMVTRIFHRLVEEHGADVSYGMVRYYVAGRKPEILVESGKAPLEAFIPQTHRCRRPGAGAEPGPGGSGTVDRVQVALRHREFLLPARHRRGPREGRSRRPDRLFPPQLLRSGPGSLLAR
ncbi:hypothetical protein [Streptomyces sp. NPDC048637]|uniref:hypothetical protein n=1 Tax=Streptomyces sp. NPDC048637 TaxID=3155636 RepID=UPI003424A77C